MPRLSLHNASILFPARKNQNLTAGVGANFVNREGRTWIASLDRVSLEVQNGDRVAIIGTNGSGKSTLLRLAAGIYMPNEGSVQIEGKAATLFSATIGLSAEASAEKNIRDAAYLMSIPKDRHDQLVEEIIEFAELQKFAKLPMRTYSTGMQARIGFGIATSHDADILLIDEVFGAGDTRFQIKARERLERYMEKAGILMLASHSTSIIRNFCNKAAWMDQGKLRLFGDIEAVLSAYMENT